jgi:hypothetical protein
MCEGERERTYKREGKLRVKGEEKKSLFLKKI